MSKRDTRPKSTYDAPLPRQRSRRVRFGAACVLVAMIVATLSSLIGAVTDSGDQAPAVTPVVQSQPDV